MLNRGYAVPIGTKIKFVQNFSLDSNAKFNRNAYLSIFGDKREESDGMKTFHIYAVFAKKAE
jgi:hypothetical protein